MKTIYSPIVAFVLVVLCASSVFAAQIIPTVSSVSPSASTGVAVNTAVSITFSTGMTTSTLTTSSFYIKDSAGNQVATNNPVATNSNKTFTITPSSNLSPCSTYTIIVTTSVQSNSSPKGNLAVQYSKTFQTVTDSAAPTVTSTVPTNGATGVIESNQIKVTFNKMVDTSTIDATTFGLDNSATGNITFSTSTTNGTIAIFTPSPNLVSSTYYTATVSTGIKSTCNVSLASSYAWHFTVRDTISPYITSTVPSAGAVNIARTSPITINFSEQMQTITSSNISVYNGTTSVSGTVSFDSTSKLTATFTPSSTLDFNTLYTVTVTGAQDLGGNTFAGSPYTFTFTTVSQEIMQYCNIPPFVSRNPLQANVLLIMDNSNSMDEDFTGAAVGSFSSQSKSVAGKAALTDIVQTYSDTMRLGLMTYKLPSSSKYYVSNSPYFVSYEPKSWCPSPPDDCNTYCATGDTASQTVCHNECVLQNTSFDETYMDEVITAQTPPDARRTKYCGLVYPKTLRMINPSDPTRYIYYKQALPYYTSSAPGNQYDYAQTYHPLQEITNTTTNTDSYNIWTTKTGTDDTYSGYSGSGGASAFRLTDSDLANGYGNIGRRMASMQTGRTWFANSSPGIGYIQVSVDSNDNVNTQKNKLLAKLTTYSGNETGYMSCTSTSDPNTCSYIVNAGLTPTAGTLQTSIDYFTGSSSPIQQPCQKNYIVYVTDGLPSVSVSGTTGSATTLIGDDTSPAAGTVLSKLDALRTISKTLSSTSYTFDVKTYIIGLGLSANDKTKLEMMARHGGTSQAYYADNTTQLTNALNQVFTDINLQISSGTSASIVNNRGESGSNLFQAVFYPKKMFKNGTELSWTGDLQNLWYYIDPLIGVSSIREDTDFDSYLDLRADDKVTVEYDSTKKETVAKWYQDTTGYGNFVYDAAANNRTTTTPESPDNIHALWRAGSLLHYRSAASRTIYSVLADHNGRYITDVYDTAHSSYHSTPSTSLSGFTLFNTANDTSFSSYLNTSDTDNIINYVRGVDNSLYRSRAVSITYPTSNPDPLNTNVPGSSTVPGVGVWKLGDIVSSTPQALTSKQLHAFDSAYNDYSYSKFYNSYDYNRRNMVFTGANDGMLHAFRIGQVTKPLYNASYPYRLAKITGLDSSLYIGDEEWAFIPQNSLPYLKYLADPAYNHIYYVNNTVSLVDISINKPASTTVTCTQSEYWKCDKKTTYSNTTTKSVNFDETSWRTVLIGGMGYGGASRDQTGYCNNYDGSTPASAAAETRHDCVKSPLSGTGLSSFFAVDVTNPTSPLFMWEFSDTVMSASDKGLGFSTSGPAIVRISARRNSSEQYGTPDLSLNGRWFAVFATGPSGPIDTISHQFMGKSDNTLKVYVVDLHPNLSSGWVKNTNYWVFDSGIKNAFAGDINDAVVDVDRWNSSSNGYYSDDVVYIGYTRPNVTASTNPDSAGGTQWTQAAIDSSSTWTQGGVLRLLTNDSLNPSDWTLSTMIDGVGPVTTAVTKLQDRKNRKLWTYFGTGRFFYKNDTGSDDALNNRYILGVQDTCYNELLNSMNAGFSKINNVWVKQGCGVAAPATLGLSDLQDQSTSISTSLASGKKGWSIKLDDPGTYSYGSPLVSSTFDAERVVTNTIASSNGIVYFTTFKPSNGACNYGGTTLEWIVDYANGGVPPASALKGKLLIQLSSGQFITVDISSATKTTSADDNTRLNRRIKASLAGYGEAGGRQGSLQSPSQPVRKILHIMER